MNQAEHKGHDPALGEEAWQQIGNRPQGHGGGNGRFHQPGGQGNNAQGGQGQGQGMGQGKGGDDGQGLYQGGGHAGGRLPASGAPDQYRREQECQQEQDMVVANQDMVNALPHKPLEGLPAGIRAQLLAALSVTEGGAEHLIVLLQPQQTVMIRVVLKQEPVIHLHAFGGETAIAAQVQRGVVAIHMVVDLQAGERQRAG